MRIAIISDIHGNCVALESVLNDLKSEHIDRIICLGDIATDGPQSREVITQLKALIERGETQLMAVYLIQAQHR